MSVKMIEKQYKNYGKCIFLENDKVSLGVTAELGPRIIYFALKDKQNVLYEDIDRVFFEDVEGFGRWYTYGGHRLWLSPEVKPQTYQPDNDPIKYSYEKGKLIVSPAADVFGKRLSIEIELDPDEPVVRLTHIIENVSDTPQEFAPWSITALCPGGVSKVPLCTRESGFLPNRVISLWDYADLSDPRFCMTNSEARVYQDKLIKKAFKAGFNVEDGFSVYAVNEQYFVKNFGFEGLNYPDYLCNFEVFTNSLFMENEALGDLRAYMPGEKAVISESWTLIDNLENHEPDLAQIRATLKI